MTGWTAWRDVAASERTVAEEALDHLSEDGFVVTSRELSRDGPWRIEIFGEDDRPSLQGEWTWEVLPDKDWVAENQRSFQPFRVGPFWVHPSHARDGLPAGADRRRDHRPVAFAEDFDAPRPIARDLAAGDDETLLGEMLQRLLAGRAVGCGHFQPGRPDAHAASMKLSKTFLGPAFSNSMSSLLPSTATMRP